MRVSERERETERGRERERESERVRVRERGTRHAPQHAGHLPKTKTPHINVGNN